MRPSIMSLGATASAPAAAWEIAVLASSSIVRSLSTVPSLTTPQCPCVRVLAEADVGDHDELGVCLLQGTHRHLDHALVVVCAGAELVLGGGDSEQDHGAHAGRVSSVASATASVIESRSTPGIASIGSRTPRRRSRTAAGRGARGTGSSRGRGRAGAWCGGAVAGAWREMLMAADSRSAIQRRLRAGFASGGGYANRRRATRASAKYATVSRARCSRLIAEVARPPRGSPSEASRRRAEGEGAREHPGSRREALADRAGGDQGEECDRQGRGRTRAERWRGPRGRRRRSPSPCAANAAPVERDRGEDDRDPLPLRSFTNSSSTPSSSSATTTSRSSRARSSRPAAPMRLTSPRVSRANVFSSRSSASEPATSRTVTNIRVMAIATETAKVSSGGMSPRPTSFSTAIGWRTEASSSSANAEVRRWPARANSITWSTTWRCGPVRSAPHGHQARLGLLQAEDVEGCRAAGR